jgi:predicted NBD/HSP70 family sugar kinase
MGAVLAVMRHSGAVTGTDLIEATGLARATVIAVCDDLANAGWIRELQALRPPSQKGRPARVFEFDARAGAVVGIDFGVAKTTVVVADLHGGILARATEILGALAGGAPERVAALNRAIGAALAGAGVAPAEVLAAGVGLAAPVDRNGNIPHSQAFWEHFDIGIPEELGGRYGWPVLLANDANLAAMAEHWMGAGVGLDDLAVMLAGERIGFGLMESGRLLRGASGRAGEVGRLELVNGVGTADGIAPLVRELAAREFAAAGVAVPARGASPAAPRQVTAEAVFAAAAGGDAPAQRVLDAVARRMARVIALLATFMDPELVVIGGAVAESSRALLAPLGEELAKFMPTPPRVAVSSLGNAIVTLGAVRLALDHVEDNVLDLVPARAAGPAPVRSTHD